MVKFKSEQDPNFQIFFPTLYNLMQTVILEKEEQDQRLMIRAEGKLFIKGKRIIKTDCIALERKR